MRATVRTSVVLSHITGGEESSLSQQVCNGGNNNVCNNNNNNTQSCGCPYVDSVRRRENENCGSLGRKEAVRVLVTGAAGQIAYSLLPLIASGKMFGPHQKIILHLLDIEPAKAVLEGVVLELEDCAFPLLEGIVPTTDVKTAFSDVDYALLIGSFPRKEGMERKELLNRNIQIFRAQGTALNTYSSPNVKVLVVGNPANTNCWVAKQFAPRIPKSNFSALTRLDANRAKGLVGKKLNVDVKSIRNVIIWGNHSSTQFPDVRYAYVDANHTSSDAKLRDKIHINVRSQINDDAWIKSTFVPAVQQRGAKIISLRKLSSAASAANAIVDHMHDWVLGTEREGEMVSMGVWSDGAYGVAEGLIFSFPVLCERRERGLREGGGFRIVRDLEMDEESKRMMKATEKELVEERTMALEILKAAETEGQKK